MLLKTLAYLFHHYYLSNYTLVIFSIKKNEYHLNHSMNTFHHRHSSLPPPPPADTA